MPAASAAARARSPPRPRVPSSGRGGISEPMPDFDEVQFPPDIAYGAVGGPEYRTTVLVTASGREQRNSAWAQARGRWNVAHGLKSRAQVAALIAFFRARKGRAHGFRFKDWTDYQATGQPLGTGDGTTTAFQ